jgi:hypothetical protein
MLRLRTIVAMTGHDRIDILKMDIEGAEYQVIDDIIKSNIDIGQILIEFHHRFIDNGIRMTKKSINKLNQHGYKVFNISNSGEEFSLIKS